MFALASLFVASASLSRMEGLGIRRPLSLLAASRGEN
jgi:hypothetical protein